jgi:hypothetical protein
MESDGRDEPIAELRELGVETSDDFTSRLRRRLERKEVANHFLWALWHLPATVLLEFLDIAFGLVNSNRGDGGGTS